MKDYEITIKIQVQASDSISQDDVLSEIMSHVSLTPTLIDADKDKKSKQFRDFLQSVSGEVNEIDEGAFAESGTQIKTYFVVIDR